MSLARTILSVVFAVLFLGSTALPRHGRAGNCRRTGPFDGFRGTPAELAVAVGLVAMMIGAIAAHAASETFAARCWLLVVLATAVISASLGAVRATTSS
jgi:hypothetical protein